MSSNESSRPAFQASAITDLVNPPDVPVHYRTMLADTPDNLLSSSGAVICCGNEVHYGVVALEGARLYHMKLAPLVVVSGGNNIWQDGVETLVSESRAMREILLQQGVPDDAIIVESEARNIKENIIFSRDKLEDVISDKFDGNDGVGLKSVIVVGRRSCAYRFQGTSIQQLPGVDVMFKGADDIPGVTPENLHEYPDVARQIFAEFMKIPSYIARGDMAPLGPDHIISDVNCEEGLAHHTKSISTGYRSRELANK